jgi:hypothetical protein
LLLSFALEQAIRKVQEKHVGLGLNWTHQLLAYADDVNLLGHNIDSIKKYKGSEIWVWRMLLPLHQDTGQISSPHWICALHMPNASIRWMVKCAHDSNCAHQFSNRSVCFLQAKRNSRWGCCPSTQH